MKLMCKMITCSCIACILFWSKGKAVHATEIKDLPYILIDSYELTSEKVVPGKEFTLTLYIRNTSKSVVAYDVMVTVNNPNGVQPVYGTVPQVQIDKLDPDEVTEVSFGYTTMEELTMDYLDFPVYTNSTVGNSVILRVPMGVDSPFTILAAGIPAEMYTDEIASTYVSFKVLGDSNVRNVSLELQIDGETITKSAIGTLTPGVTRTQSLSPMIGTPGVYEAKLVLYYDDEAEQTQSIVVSSTAVNVIKKTAEGNTGTDVVEIPQEESIDKNILMGVGGIFILLILAVSVFVIRRRR